MDRDPDSPLFGRISRADDKKTELRCITVNSIFTELERSELFVAAKQRGKAIVHGPFFDHDQAKCLARTVRILNSWFGEFQGPNREWWEAGSGSGGGLAMNDSVVAMIRLLRSVVEFLERRGMHLVTKSAEEVAKILSPYAQQASVHLSKFNEGERLHYRSQYGEQARTSRMRVMQEAILQTQPDFDPAGLAQFLRDREANTQGQARELIDLIEKELQSFIVSKLKDEYGEDDDLWFYEGVPPTNRKKVRDRIDEGKGKTGSFEHNFDLVDYQAIALFRWNLFE